MCRMLATCVTAASLAEVALEVKGRKSRAALPVKPLLCMNILKLALNTLYSIFYIQLGCLLIPSGGSPIDTAIQLKNEHREPHNAEQESVGTSFCRISYSFKILVVNRLHCSRIFGGQGCFQSPMQLSFVSSRRCVTRQSNCRGRHL